MNLLQCGLENSADHSMEKERLGDAEIVFNDAFVPSQVKSYFQSPNNPVRKAEIKSWLNSFLKYYEYSAAYIFDTSGNECIRVCITCNYSSAYQRIDQGSGYQRKAVLSDFTGVMIHRMYGYFL